MQPQAPALPTAYHAGYETLPKWSGVVSIERPDLSRTPHVPGDDPACRVLSARTMEFNGRRAIVTHLPYSAVKHYFQAEDADQVFVAASLHGEHLQLHERCDLKEWAYFSGLNN